MLQSVVRLNAVTPTGYSYSLIHLYSHDAKRRPIKCCHPNWMGWSVSYTEQCYLRLACRHLYLAGSFGGLFRHREPPSLTLLFQLSLPLPTKSPFSSSFSTLLRLDSYKSFHTSPPCGLMHEILEHQCFRGLKNKKVLTHQYGYSIKTLPSLSAAGSVKII